MTEAAFLLVAAVLIPSSVLVVTAPNLFHGALALALTLVGTAVLYLLLAAELLALIQVLLYAGGVVTLVVFAITVTGRLGGDGVARARGRLPGLAVSLGLFALLAAQLLEAGLPGGWPEAPAEPTRTLTESLLTTYLLPFEALSALLLAAMVAAIVLARRDGGADAELGVPADAVASPTAQPGGEQGGVGGAGDASRPAGARAEPPRLS